MRRYFYSLYRKYLSLYIRPEDRVFWVFGNDSQEVRLQKNDWFQSVGSLAVTDIEQSNLDHLRGLQFDYVIVDGAFHYSSDIQMNLSRLAAFVTPTTRVIVVHYSQLWRPLVTLATRLGLRSKTPEQNWISPSDLINLLALEGFETVKSESKFIFPFRWIFVGSLLNRYLGPLPTFSWLSLLNISIARKRSPLPLGTDPSVSIVIPARNESGNIENALKRVPKMGPNDEIIFVEGNSTDDTWQTIQQMASKYRASHRIKCLRQQGKGKGDAVRKGFSVAQNDIFMILDADLTVPPEDLPKFYNAIKSGVCEFANGSRLVYPMEKKAMRFFNMIGNKFFAAGFTFVLGQSFKDTLCGTKVLSRRHYEKLLQNRSYFGDFDPFGDFDLLFGSSRLCLKIVDIPISYKERTYGDTNIQRWRHGAILLRMLVFAALRIKFI